MAEDLGDPLAGPLGDPLAGPAAPAAYPTPAPSHLRTDHPAAGAADLLVVTSTVREDTGYSGLWMLDALQVAGYQDLKHKTLTVLPDPSPQVDDKLAGDLVGVYTQRTRAVHRVPYDPALVDGSVVPYAPLSHARRGPG